MTTTASVTPGLTTLTAIRKLEERYPFNTEELEILVRCHDHLKNNQDSDDFLMKMALTSPYSYFFLPGEEMRDRVDWIENHVLPPGFANELRAAISADAFVEYANQGEEKTLERFIEGVADTGRRGPREALRVLLNIVGGAYAKPEDVIDVVFRLALASEALTSPNVDRESVLRQVNSLHPMVVSVSESLNDACGGKNLNLQTLVTWAESSFPMFSSPLSTFVHTLLFHGHAYPAGRIPYSAPKLDRSSDVFKNSKFTSLIALSLASPMLGSEWHRLYSSEMDGRSFNRLEWSLLGYGGPTLLVLRTTGKALLGAFTSAPWKECHGFQGDLDSFLFQLAPRVRVMPPIGKDKNFMFMHSKDVHSSIVPESGLHPHGIGFGGTLEKPRLFIPESFENCSAGYLDRTFQPGHLLPETELEKFELSSLEVWGVGGDTIVKKALHEQKEYRERTNKAILRARTVQDKEFVVRDIKAGLVIGDKLFSHVESTRGRPEFRVDDKHGGYKIEH